MRNSAVNSKVKIETEVYTDAREVNPTATEVRMDLVISFAAI